MSCICTVDYSVLVNGNRTPVFSPSRGIRQGDPLSPYIFILCMEYLSLKINQLIHEKSWKAFRLNRNGPLLSHFLFVDDVLLCAKATKENCAVIGSALNDFCELSGQVVNTHKSRIIFSKNINEALRQGICTDLKMQETQEIEKYLGFPISDKKPSKQQCHFILNKINSKLAGWKSRLLSIAGRTTLIKYVIGSTASYFMQAMELPASIHNDIDKISRKFLWGDTNDKKKIHPICWEIVTKPKPYGGLGIRASKNLNESYMAKLGWDIITNKDALWVKILRGKYLNTHSNSTNRSPFWKSISQCSGILKKGTKWNIMNGALAFFWEDNWTGLGPLRNFVIGPLNSHETLCPVNKFINDSHGWDFNLLSLQPPQSVKNIITAIPIQRHNQQNDTLSWGSKPDGIFSIKQAYCISIGVPTDSKNVWKWIWSTPTYPKIHHLFWLIAHERVITRSYLKQIGVTHNDTCPVCAQEPETIEHLFRTCRAATTIWDQLQGPCSDNDLDFSSWCKMNWTNRTLSPFHHIPWSFLFPLAIWKIWLNRNKSIFPSNTVSADPITYIINAAVELYALSPEHSHPLSRQIALFSWEPPPNGYLSSRKPWTRWNRGHYP